MVMSALIRTENGAAKLLCPVCNKALTSLNGYVKHVKKHEPPGGFFCRYCDARFCTEDDVKRHCSEIHTMIACRICGEQERTFTNEHDYREHIRIVHNGIDRKMFKCEKCGLEYKTIEPYRRHIENLCGAIKPYKCDQCSISFVTKYNLKQHKQSHSGERKFCCSYCGKNFLQKGRLVEHERCHTGEKPYKCDACGKCFAHRESIVTHTSIHTGIRLVECHCCQTRFSCYSNLIKHRRTRPDTCGLPQYDPIKNRVRSHRSRIPATLNPTSEIKVSSFNKVIKPDDKDKEQTKKVKKKNKNKKLQISEPAKEMVNKNKIQAKQPPEMRRKKTKIKKIKYYSEETKKEGTESNTTNPLAYTDDESSTNCDGDDEDDTKKPAGKNSANSDNYIDLIEYIQSNEEQELKYFNEMPVPTEKSVEMEKEMILDCFKTEINEKTPIYINKSNSKDKESEEEENIFNQKEKLLDNLLNDNKREMIACDSTDNLIEDDNTSSPPACQLPETMPPSEELKLEEKFLEETEIILVDGIETTTMREQDSVEEEEEFIVDILNVSPSTEDKVCKDLKERTKLKGENVVKGEGRNNKIRQKRRKQKASKCHSMKSRKQDQEKSKETEAKKLTESQTTSALRKTSKRTITNRFSQQELKIRMRFMKNDGKTWPCPHCIKIYHMRKPFEKHLRDDHQRSEEEIQKLFKAAAENLVTTDEVLQCDICEKIYLVAKRLEAHKLLHGPERNLIYKCPCYCSVYFATKAEATQHAHQEHRDLLYCKICEKFMTGHDSLKNHKRNYHGEKTTAVADATSLSKRNLVCDKCGKKFSGRTSLTDHVRSDCGRMPLYPCNLCGKHLTTAGILKTHMLLHKEETPFQCDKCGKTFKVKAQYKTHIKTRHTDDKPFKCHLCPKEYPYRESLLTHMTVHTGIKRFLCNGCGKRFTCISNLQAHRKVHVNTCGQLPLNAKATQYMGVQKGNLLLGAKPEAGLDYQATNTLIAREVIHNDLPMLQEKNYLSEPSLPTATVPLNYSPKTAQSQLVQQERATISCAPGSQLLQTPQQQHNTILIHTTEQ